MTINLKPSEDKNIFDIPTDCKVLTGNYYKVTNIKGWLIDVVLEAVSETKYMDYFPYSNN